MVGKELAAYLVNHHSEQLSSIILTPDVDSFSLNLPSIYRFLMKLPSGLRKLFGLILNNVKTQALRTTYMFVLISAVLLLNALKHFPALAVLG
ncbi:hypothetical protein K7X08_009020 [Anisodus acutangulus]|uniref:Uncharacterized protein n=1 Tax=Anisodus acutangulus TaxID=402998 RepID=A0A9Q1RT37_9SOLA|nr:hypothetical protein K7X08_009020 [Anisodus acutangulus]